MCPDMYCIEVLTLCISECDLCALMIFVCAIHSHYIGNSESSPIC